MAKAKTFQQMSDELQALIDWFESGQASLDQAVDKYRQAMELIAQMDSYIKTAENQIKTITAKFDK